MNNKGQISGAVQMIQNALGAYLQTRKSLIDVGAESQHLDEDVLTAFVESNLSENEARPVISHLADCSYCLHISAELIKLDLAIAGAAAVIEPPAAEPSGVGNVLSGILSRIFGSNDGAVFAHEEKSEEEEKEDSTEENE